MLPSPLIALLLMGCFWLIGRIVSRRSRFYGQLLDQAPGRANAIDGLRGFLALAVLIHHAAIIRSWYGTGLWKPPQSLIEARLGPVPVALFFMITGFLFWSKAIKASGRISLSRLIANRIRRLAPAYLASVLLVVVIVMVQSRGEILVPWLVLVKTLVKLLMLGLWSWPYSLNLQPLTPVNANVVWSLQYEWGFYLALPMLAIIGPGRRFFWLLLPMGGVAIGFLIANGQTEIAGWIAYFPLGMLAAEWVQRGWLDAWPKQMVWTLVSLAMLLLSLSVDRFWLPIHLLTFPFFLAVAHGNDFFGLLQTKTSRFLGTISYSIYLLHGIVLSVVLALVNLRWPIVQMGDWTYWPLMAPIGLLVVIASAVSYRGIEHPWLTGGAKKR